MRPISRGAAPVNAFKHYREAFSPLSTRLGKYCSYCERRLPTHLAVEHVQPKSKKKALALQWDNFLLACCNCNSCKGDDDVQLADYIWPDVNNTITAFSYSHGMVRNMLDAAHPAHAKVDALIVLTGLDKDPGHPDRKRRPDDTDQRWKDRLDIWEKANRSKLRLAKVDCVDMRDEIIEAAVGWGGFAIWFEVFKDDVDMCVRLIQAFPGTAPDCFDKHLPILRPGTIL